MWTHLEPKDPKNGNSKKHCKTHDILMVGGLSWAMLVHLGAMLAYLEGNVGPSWGYVGRSWGYVGPSLGLWCPILGLCWPILRLCWPILGLCCPILGARLPHAEAMLVHLAAYVGPCCTSSEKWEKMGRAQNTVKRGGFWPYRLYCGWGGGPSLLRRGEKRLRLCHGQGAPGRI